MMSSENDIRTVIHSEVEFTAKDNYKYILPLQLRGTDASLSEITLLLVMARDAKYRMPNDLRVYLSQRKSESQDPPLNLTGVISRHYVHHLRKLFPSQDELNDRLRPWATEFVEYHADIRRDERQVQRLLTALWKGLPANDTDPDDPRWELGNGAKGDRFAKAHWFTLPHAVVPIPPLPLLASDVGDAIREMEGDLVLEVTSGDPSMKQLCRSVPEAGDGVVAPKTCGAFTLTVAIARTNPLAEDLETLAGQIAKHEERLNDLKSQIVLTDSDGKVTLRLDGNTGDVVLL